MVRLRHNPVFTLVELVLVMGVMALTLAVTAPNLARFLHGRSVREEARQFVAVTRRAAAYAAAHSCRTVVWIDLSGEPVQYGWRLVETFHAEEDEQERTLAPAEGIQLTATPKPDGTELAVTFGADGSVDADDELEIVFAAGPDLCETAVVRFVADEGIFVVADGPEDDGEDDE